METKLSRSNSKLGKLKSLVVDFNIIMCRQPLPDDESYREEGEQHEEHEDMPSENYCDFTVYITDSSGNKGLVVEATSMDTEISYNAVQVTDDIAEAKKIHRFERQMKSYPGPDFSTLDERI